MSASLNAWFGAMSPHPHPHCLWFFPQNEIFFLIPGLNLGPNFIHSSQFLSPLIPQQCSWLLTAEYYSPQHQRVFGRLAPPRSPIYQIFHITTPDEPPNPLRNLCGGSFAIKMSRFWLLHPRLGLSQSLSTEIMKSMFWEDYSFNLINRW